MSIQEKIFKYCFRVSFVGFFIPLVFGLPLLYFSRIISSTLLMSVVVSLLLLYIITVFNSYRFLINNVPLDGEDKIYVGLVRDNPLFSKPFIIIKSDQQTVELTNNIDALVLDKLIGGITPNRIQRFRFGKCWGRIFEVR